MHRKTVARLAMMLCASPLAMVAQDNREAGYVYLVRIPATTHHEPVYQTGFRLRGTKGIITALHGVADAETFSAMNEQGDVLNGMTIAKVDVDDDLVLLRSRELEDRPEEGLDPGQNLPAVRARLTVLGHPAGINLYPKTVYVGDPVLKAMHTLVPMGPVGVAFNSRGSPSNDIRVVNIEGSLVAGDSGAPVLDSSNRVVGVGDGGLLGGAAAISWAIPISAVLDTERWQSAGAASSRIRELAGMDTRNLFALQVADAPASGQWPWLPGDWLYEFETTDNNFGECKETYRDRRQLHLGNDSHEGTYHVEFSEHYEGKIEDCPSQSYSCTVDYDLKLEQVSDMGSIYYLGTVRTSNWNDQCKGTGGVAAATIVVHAITNSGRVSLTELHVRDHSGMSGWDRFVRVR